MPWSDSTEMARWEAVTQQTEMGCWEGVKGNFQGAFIVTEVL